MSAMTYLLAVVEPATTAASMAICRPEAIDDAPARRAGAQRRMAAVRLCWLARNGRAGVPARHVAWGGPPGEESLTTAGCGQVIEAQPSVGQIKPPERPRRSRAKQHPGEDVAGIRRPAQDARFIRRRIRNSGGQKAVPPVPTKDGARVADTGLSAEL